MLAIAFRSTSFTLLYVYIEMIFDVNFQKKILSVLIGYIMALSTFLRHVFFQCLKLRSKVLQL